MSYQLRNWIKKLSETLRGANSRHVRRHRTNTSRPTLQLLEDRITPTNFNVIDLSDNAGSASDVTLRYAVNNAVNGDSVTFDPSISGPGNTITLSPGNGPLVLSQSITITGPGAANMAISGGGSVQDFAISNGVTVSITGLTIENGLAATGAGIFNAGTLSVSNSTITGNHATALAGGIANGGTLTLTGNSITGNTAASAAGGVGNSGTLTMSGDTISGNSAAAGGGVGNNGTLTSTSDIITGNTALLTGGGIGNEGTLSLTDSTISGNSAAGSGSGIYSTSSSVLSISSSAGTNISNNINTQGAGDITLAGSGSTTISGNINLGPTGNLVDSGTGAATVSGVISGSAASGTTTIQGLVGTYFNINNQPASGNDGTQMIAPASPSNPLWLGNQTPAATAQLVGPIDFQNISGNGFADSVGNPVYYNAGGGNNNVEARWYGDITIPGTGATPVPISFGLASDDGSMLYIDGQAVVSNNAYQGSPGYPGLQVTHTVDLSPGVHTIDVEYYNGGGGASVWAQWDPTGGSNFVDIPNSVFSSVVPQNGVIQSGSGTLTLSHSNSYIGSTTINAGKLIAAADGAMGPATAAGVVVNKGGALAFAGGVNYTTAEPVSIYGTGPTQPNPTSYVGFTGATGGLNSVQDILNWTYTSGATTIDDSGGFSASNLHLNGHASILGNGNLQLTDGNNNESSSAWTPAPVNAGSFTTSFQWTFAGTNPNPADGFTFAVQNDSNTALGAGGSGLGYGGIPGDSFAVQINLYTGSGTGSGSDFGVGINGSVSHPIDLTAHGINFQTNPGDTYQATISDDGQGNVTVTLLDTNSGATYTQTFNVSGSYSVPGNGAIENISGVNSFAGPITVAGPATVGADAGSLNLNGGMSLGSSALTLSGAGAATISGAVSSNGGTLAGAGAGAETVSGNVSCSGSGLNLDSTTALTISGNIDLGAAGNLTDNSTGHDTISGVISGSGTGSEQGLIGQYFNIGATQSLIQPAAPSNANWLGNHTPAVTAQLVGPIDFPDIQQDGNAMGFTDTEGNTYYNLNPTPGAGDNNNVEGRWYGDIDIPNNGIAGNPISFQTGSDDGSMLYIDGNAVVNNNFFQGVVYRSATVDLTPGLHTIDVEYYQGGGGAAMDAQWDPNGGNSFVDIPNSVFSVPNNGVTMNGSGTLTLSNGNTYNGPTTVNAGILQVNGTTGTGNGAVTVKSGGTLAGHGTTGAVSNDGTINPGLGTPATLSTGSLTFGSGLYTVTADSSSNYTSLNVTGNIDLTGGILNVNLGYTPAAGVSFTILHNVDNTPITGTFSAVLDGITYNLPEGAYWDFGGTYFTITYLGNAGHDVVLTSTATHPTYGETLDASGNLTIYQEDPGANDNLQFSLAGGVYTLTDVGGLLFDNPGGANSVEISGGLTSTITVPSADVTSITVSLGVGMNVFDVTAADATLAPLSVNTGLTAGDQLNVEVPLTVSGALSLASNAVTDGSTLNVASLSVDSGGTSTLSGNVATSGSGVALGGSGSITVSGNINLGATGNLSDASTGSDTVSGVISGTAATAVVQGLSGDYYNLGASQSLIAPANASNPNWLGNQTPAVTALLVGPIDFQDINDTGAAMGFTDPLGNTYYNLNPTPGAGDNNNVEARWFGDIDIPNNGNAGNPISFGLASDDGSMLYIDGQAVVNNNFFQGSPGYPGLQVTNTVDLTPGLHTIDVEYYNGGGGASVWAQWDPAGGSNFVDIPNSAFSTVANINSVTKTGSGTLTLTHANTYVGATTIDGGKLIVTANGAMGPASDPGIFVNSGGALALSGGVNYATAEAIAISGAGLAGNGAIENLSGNNTFSGSITVQGNATIGSDAGALTLNGAATPTCSINNGNLTTTGAGNIDLEDVLQSGQGASSYVGFTGATGGLNATQNILTWTYQSGATLIDDSTGFASNNLTINGNAQYNGAFPGTSLQLTDGNNGESASAWTPTPVPVGNFVSTFQWTYQNTPNPFDPADGFTFAVQNDNNRVVGGGGGGLGYNGIPGNSYAVEFNVYSGSGTGTGSDFGVGYNGAVNHPIDLTSHDINFHNNYTDTFEATVVNNGAGLLTVTIWDATLNPTGSPTGGAYYSTTFTAPTYGALIKNGTGTLTLSNADNPFTGATIINAGHLLVTADGAMGPANALGVYVNNGGALAFSGGLNYTTAEAVSINGAGPAGNGAIENLSGVNSFAGAISVAGQFATIGSDAASLTLSGNIDLGAVGNLTVNGAGQTTLSGVISGTGTGSVQTAGLVGTYFNLGANQNLISPANSSNPNWLGNQIPAATAQLVGPIDFRNISANGFADSVGDPNYYNPSPGNNNNVEARWYGDILIPGTGVTPVPISFGLASDDGSMLYIDGTAVVNNNFFQGSPGYPGLQRTNTVDLTPGLHAIDVEYYQGGGGASVWAEWDPTGGSNFVDIPNSAFVVPGVNDLNKIGSGTLTLANTNTYTGATTVNAGHLVVTADGAMGPASAVGVFVNAGGALGFTGGLNYTTAEPTTIVGSGPAGNGAIENLGGVNSFAAPITLGGNATIGADAGSLTLSGNVNMGLNNLTATGAGQTTISGVISGTSGSGLTGTYFNLGATQNLIQPAAASNPNWLGNQISAATARLIGAIDFQNIAANGFQDNVGNTYYDPAPGNNNNVEARWYGDIIIPGTGNLPVPISFGLASDDGSMLYIDGVAVVNNNHFQGSPGYPGLQVTNTVDLTPGLHTIDVEYYQGGGGASVWAQWDPTGGNNFVDIPNSAFFTGGDNLIKNGAGSLTLANSNTYLGSTTINAGTLIATSTGAMGPSNALGVQVNAGGALAFAGNVNYSTTEPITINGSGPAGHGAIENLSDSNTFYAPITLGSDATIGSDAGTLDLNYPNLNLSVHNLTTTGAGITLITSALQQQPGSFVGFTGGTGGAASEQDILNWTYVSGSTDIDYSGGFASSNLSLNNGASVQGTELQLTDGGYGEARTAWTQTPVPVGGFNTSFQWTYGNTFSPQADGFTFAIQNDSNTAVGNAGGALAYSGIPGQSLAVQFNLYNGVSTFGIGYDGVINDQAVDLTAFGIDFHANPTDTFRTNLVNDGAGDLTITIFDATLNPTGNPGGGAYFTYTFSLSSAFVGFTGATGGAASTQQILNWTYSSGATNINYSGGFNPNTLSLNGNASVQGSALQLTDGNNGEASSAWTATQVPVGSFTTTFQWTYGPNPQADGFTFALQQAGNTALGGGGGSLGYAGIPGNSVAVEFNLYNGVSTFGIGFDGDINHPSDLTASGIDFHAHPSDVFQATITDNGLGDFTVSIWDTTLNTSATPNYTVTIAFPVVPLSVADEVTQDGTGTTILSGVSDYTGATTVSEGTLQVDGNITTSSGVTVAAGATLSGIGTVPATTVHGTLEPGDIPQAGTLNTDLDFTAGSTLHINEAGGVCSEVNVNGSASLTGAALSVSFADIVGVGSMYTIVHTTGGLGGTTFNGLPNGGTVVDTTNGQVFEVTYTSTDVILTKMTGSAPAPSITNVVINQNISALYNAAGQPAPGTQRSMVNDIVYTFSEAVNIVGPGTDPNVFTITIAAGWTGTLPTLSWAPVAGSGDTQWAVSFTGSGVSGGSIANGAYTITVNHPSEITAVSDGQDLSLAGSGIGSATQSFYRLFGDINGDEFVNAADNLKFKPALTTYNAAFDYNADGFVNASDNLKFKADLTVNFSGFTPTIYRTPERTIKGLVLG